MRQKAGSAIPTHMRNDMSSEEAVERGMEKQDEMALHTLTGRAMDKMQTVQVAGHGEKGRKAGRGCVELRTGELVVCVDSERTLSTR
ncbi:hypothetical protein BLNAU_7401 [Blattamonas nauphoetae]|uniref:Uncharacterized protein n=1 Tax=Blattamonas nauphoetae TaxID=2049346 RepID=A0ABQ9Y184_9EUKA|nr:hypothetical protein BLNAU_7401 [Blattamonas nauphoetae]